MSLRNWFDNLSSILESEARHAGLLEHGSMIGSVREFLVQRVLKSVLPPLVHTGSGRVIDSHGNASRQIDIVLFDARFPRFESIPGVGLFPLEGVIAAIEVKSKLDNERLSESFDNCLSVTELKYELRFNEGFESLKRQFLRKGKTEEHAAEAALSRILPATYVFSFHGASSARTMAEWIHDWIRKVQVQKPSTKQLQMPRIAFGGEVIALNNDGITQVHRPTSNTIYLCAKYKHRFGVFLSHLMSFACHRIGTHFGTLANSNVEKYLPALEYFTELNKLGETDVSFVEVSYPPTSQ